MTSPHTSRLIGWLGATVAVLLAVLLGRSAPPARPPSPPPGSDDAAEAAVRTSTAAPPPSSDRPMSRIRKMIKWRTNPPPNVPRRSPALGMYATLVDPDRSQDWQPDPTAPLGETIDRFLRCAVLSNPEVCETGYAAMDFLRRDPESVLSLLEESTSEEAVLAWCAGTAPPGARAPGGALRLAALLGTADGCSMAADRAELLFERYGVLLEEFVGRRQETYGFSKTEEGHALSRHLSAMRGAIDQIISGSGIGSCPHLRPFCRARIEERNSRYVSICASYLAWVFPNERLPSAGPPADDHWPDPPYWTPLE